ARSDRAETRRQRVDPVAVTHPHLFARTLRPQPVEQQAIVEDVDERAPELLMLAERYSAAQFVAHRLHAIADAEHRHTESEDKLRGARGRGLAQRGRAARQDDGSRREVAELVFGHCVRVDLAINPALAHPARGTAQDLLLADDEFGEILRGGVPFGVGVASPGPSAEAGYVDKYPVEAAGVALDPFVALARQRPSFGIIDPGAAQPAH